jgi:GT2 family glycosyltransferase
MKLSVIIVNYNVKFFLQQALLSVQKAARDIQAEIIVVDNHSVDGSAEMMQEKFPGIIFFENIKNEGFAKANNQGIRISKGEYILLLNPDTVVEEDTFTKCIAFMDLHPEAGALGVKMLDGQGNFLAESKRGFPTPWVAFCKAFGLSRLFSKSKIFNRYHLGFLSEDETNQVDVLSGAFMFIRRKALDKSGLLDEQFFMYGEDIDLSYRIVQAGFKNYYFADTRIIHFKGESTRKGTMNYVRMFYSAMILFAQKHFAARGAGFYTLMLKGAIYFRAALSVLVRMIRKWSLPLLDAATFYSGLVVIKDYWQNHVKIEERLTYPNEYVFLVLPAYVVIWLLSIFLSGGYEKNARPARAVRGLFFGTIAISAIYAFLPETLRFSRAMILLGFAWAVFIAIIVRMIVHFIQYKNFRIGEVRQKKTIIAGSEEEAARVEVLLAQAKIPNDLIGYVTPAGMQHANHHLGNISELSEIAAVYKIDEVIFCAKDVSSQQIIEWMTRIGTQIEYKIVPENSLSIIGSNSKDAPGELYTIDIKLAIAAPFNKRSKRIFDLIASLFLLLTFPVNLIIIKNPGQLFKNIFSVFAGQRTWVSYNRNSMVEHELPALKKGIITPADEFYRQSLNAATINRINFLYARDYSVYTDLTLFFKCYSKLGRN